MPNNHWGFTAVPFQKDVTVSGLFLSPQLTELAARLQVMVDRRLFGRFNTLILDNTRTTRPGASLGTISRARARGLWPGRFSLSCPALRI